MGGKKNEEQYAGVSIASTSINLAYLSQQNDRIYLRYYKTALMPAGFIESGRISSIDIATQTLRKFFQESKFQFDHIGVSVPSQNIVTKITEVSGLRKKELNSFLKADIEDHPVMLKHAETSRNEDEDEYVEDEKYLAYSSIEANETTETSRYFVMGAPGRMINAYRSAFNQAGQLVNLLSADIFGVLSCVQLMKPLPTESQLVIYVSEYNTEYVVVRNQAIYFYHKARTSGTAIHQSPGEAVDFLSRTSVVLMAYQDRYPEDQAVDRVVIVAYSKELADFFDRQKEELSEKYMREVVVFRPEKYISPEGKIDQVLFENDVYTLIPAIGVGLSVKRGYFLLDFLKNQTIMAPLLAGNDLKPAVVTVCILAVLIICAQGGIVYGKQYLNNKLSVLTSLVQQASARTMLDGSSKATELTRKITMLSDVLKLREERTVYYEMLAQFIPDDVWLNNVNMKTTKTDVSLTLQGQCLSEGALSRFIDNLSEEFESVKVETIRFKKTEADFSLSCGKRRDDV